MPQTEPKLCLTTLNEVSAVIEAEVKARVCELEQNMRDALKQDFYGQADQYKAAAREMDLLRYKLSSAITAVFLDELNRREETRPAVSSVETFDKPAEVELPEIPASKRTLHVVSNDRN